MTIDLEHIFNAIKALRAAEMLLCAEATPQQRGRASADCCIAASDLEVRIGMQRVEVTERQKT
jgi:hypothetical protein